MPSFKIKFSGVTILQGVEFSIFLLIFERALHQCSATALPVIRVSHLRHVFNCASGGSHLRRLSSVVAGVVCRVEYVMFVYGAAQTAGSTLVFVHHLIKVGAATGVRSGFSVGVGVLDGDK